MSRLLPCPSCGRHVRVVERECPFCASVLATVAAPGRLTVALLGLCLVACSTSNEPPPSKGGDKAPSNEQPSDVTPTPEPAQPEPKPEPTPPEPVQPEPEPEPPTTSVGTPQENGNVGTTDGSSTADEPPKPPPEPKTKYGGPRPAKKYGAPPKPPEDLDPL